jgi:hypothetical protein
MQQFLLWRGAFPATPSRTVQLPASFARYRGANRNNASQYLFRGLYLQEFAINSALEPPAGRMIDAVQKIMLRGMQARLDARVFRPDNDRVDTGFDMKGCHGT